MASSTQCTGLLVTLTPGMKPTVQCTHSKSYTYVGHCLYLVWNCHSHHRDFGRRVSMSKLGTLPLKAWWLWKMQSCSEVYGGSFLAPHGPWAGEESEHREGFMFLLSSAYTHTFGVAIYKYTSVSVTVLIKDINILPLTKEENSFHRFPGRQQCNLASPFHLQIST